MTDAEKRTLDEVLERRALDGLTRILDVLGAPAPRPRGVPPLSPREAEDARRILHELVGPIDDFEDPAYRAEVAELSEDPSPVVAAALRALDTAVRLLRRLEDGSRPAAVARALADAEDAVRFATEGGMRVCSTCRRDRALARFRVMPGARDGGHRARICSECWTPMILGRET